MRMTTALAFSTALLAASCSKPAAIEREAGPVVDGDAESLMILRESARELLDANCGECHTRGLPTALPRALAVYDLTQLDWAHRMSDAQLREAERRLRRAARLRFAARRPRRSAFAAGAR